MRQSLYVLLFIIFVIMLVPSLVLSGDSKDFKVSSFIPELFTDLEWKIGGDFNLSGNDTEYDYAVAPGFNYKNQDSWSDTDRQDLSFNTDALYVYETIARQFELDLSFRGNLSHRDNDGNSVQDRPWENYEIDSYTEADRLTYNVSTDVRATIREYLGDTFFGQFTFSNRYSDYQTAYDDWFQSNVRVRPYGDKMRVDHALDQGRRSSGRRENSSSFELAIGLGHVYEGSFASVAMYIVDELEKAGHLRRDPSQAQMIGLAEIVYYYKMKHAVDDRFLRQDALNEIIAFLEDERIVRNVGSESLYAIQDIWDYYPSRKRAPRLFGFRASAGLGYLTYYEGRNREDDYVHYRLIEEWDPADPSVTDTLTYSYEVTHSNTGDSYTYEIPYFMASVEYHQPINHLWQFDAIASTDINLEDVDEESGQRRSRDTRNNVKAQFNLTRIFDSRTTISTTLSSSLFFERDDAEASPSDPTYPDTRQVWYTDFNLKAQCAVTYRIAIPTTLSLTVNFVSEFIEDPRYAYDYSRDSHSYYIRAGISHFIY